MTSKERSLQAGLLRPYPAFAVPANVVRPVRRARHPMRMRTLLFALAALTCGAQAETLVVKDAKSLEAALQRARADKRINHIELASGQYELAAPIVIDEALSGTATAPFVIAAAPGARAVLSGTKRLPALNWQPWEGGVWRAR